MDAEVEKQRLKLFREALGMYHGRHAFHNYTKRKQYIENHDPWSYGRRNRQRRRLGKEGTDDEDDESDGDEEDTELMSGDKPTNNTRPDYEVNQRSPRSTNWVCRHSWQGRRKQVGGDSGSLSSRN